MLSGQRLAIQITGFLVGLGLLVWIILRAIEEGDWGRIFAAGPGLVLALAACTVASALFNGTTFWLTVRPLRHVPFWDLQRLNVVANMLNYAPVRLGALARVVHHVRVDGLSLLQVGAWFGFIAYILALGVGSFVVACIAREQVDVIWALLVAAQLVLGAFAVRVASGLPLLRRYGQGIDRIAADHASLWGAICLRVADLGAFVGRMAAAAAILEIHLSFTQLIILALVAHAGSLIPFGRFGFREFCVAIAADRLSMMTGEVEANMNQLALVESAGEVLVFLPFGLAGVPWLRRKWRESGSQKRGMNAEGPPAAGRTPAA
jgi:hypothetical protein